MRACLQAGGADFRDIVKITFYLTDIRDKSVVWEARKTLFGDARPASTLVAVSHLVDPHALLEIDAVAYRSEEHTSELQSLMRISYAVFCLKKKKKNHNHIY